MRQTRNAAEPNRLSVCLTVMQGNWHNVADVAKAANVNGLHSFGMADTPMLERNVYLACAAAALNTESVSIVTGVTNPVTRHPSVTAAAFLQLHELAPGRVKSKARLDVESKVDDVAILDDVVFSFDPQNSRRAAL